MSKDLCGRICSGNEQPRNGSSRLDPRPNGPDGIFRLGLQSCNSPAPKLRSGPKTGHACTEARVGTGIGSPNNMITS